MRDTPESFYQSYIDRKKTMVAGRVEAVKKGDKNVNKKKLIADVSYLKEAINNKEAILKHLEILLTQSVTLDDDIFHEAEKLTLDIK